MPPCPSPSSVPRVRELEAQRRIKRDRDLAEQLLCVSTYPNVRWGGGGEWPGRPRYAGRGGTKKGRSLGGRASVGVVIVHQRRCGFFSPAKGGGGVGGIFVFLCVTCDRLGLLVFCLSARQAQRESAALQKEADAVGTELESTKKIMLEQEEGR